LTEPSQHLHRLHGLELGSLDYITKPFDIQELRLRIRNTLARTTAFAAENPVTGLPGGDEVWASLDQARQAGRAALVVCLGGLDTFRDLYGFVASDDVLRVTGLMLTNAAREIGGETAFCGHLDENTFILMLPANRLDKLEHRIRERAVHSLEYFYPSDNRGPTAHTSDRLRLELGRILDLNVPADDLRLLRTYALGTHGSVPHSR
jgi:GGDEF domain-containing protein